MTGNLDLRLTMHNSTDLHTFSTQASQVAEQLRLPLRSQVWKGLSGEFRGAGVGSSMDFQDHRSYVPGDDPRHINWQAYARTGQYTMKLYREEVRPVIDLFIDVSDSMFFIPLKAERTAQLVYFLTHSALRAGASLRSTLIRGDQIKTVSSESILGHQWIQEGQALTPTDPAQPPAMERAPVRPNAIRVLVSDLLFEASPTPIVRALTDRQGSGLIFAPTLKSESDPEWEGNCDFIDAEKKSKHPHRISSQILERYRAAYKTHFQLWHDSAIRHRTLLTRIPAEGELHKVLTQTALQQGALERTK